MAAVFEYSHVVEPDEIDALGHVNNLAYLRWMIDAAVAHAKHQGWPMERHLELGAGWVVRAHGIEYFQPAHCGDVIVVRTWVAGFRRITSLRRYKIVRPADGTLLAEAHTRWAYVDYERRQPCRIPRELMDSFEIVAEDPGPP